MLKLNQNQYKKSFELNQTGNKNLNEKLCFRKKCHFNVWCLFFYKTSGEFRKIFYWYICFTRNIRLKSNPFVLFNYKCKVNELFSVLFLNTDCNLFLTVIYNKKQQKLTLLKVNRLRLVTPSIVLFTEASK